MSFLPTLNACLNSLCAILLLSGYVAIRAGKREVHKKFMLSAFGTSTLFLISYLTYHALHGSTKFQGQGGIRTVYFLILGTHTILAAVIVPLVLTVLYRAWKGQFEAHRKLARITFPLWMYVSVTGVVVYLMLYRM